MHGTYEIDFNNIPVETPSIKEEINLLMINGGFVPNAQIVVENGRTLMPVNIVSEILGVNVVWGDTDKTIKITDGNTTILLTIDKMQALVNGSSVALDVPSKIINSSTYVPLRFVAETLNNLVQYVPKLTYGVKIDTDTQGTFLMTRERVSLVSI